MSLLNTIKNAVKKNPDKVSRGVDKATDAIDDRTGSKYTDKLEKVDQMAADKLNTGRTAGNAGRKTRN